MTTSVRRIEVGGAEVAYRRAGSGPTVLVLPGLGFTGRWLPLYDRLAERCDTIVVDPPGFGDSAPAEWMRDFDDLALHFAELADRLELGRFHLVGHSFGGWVAAELAAFYPERLASLTLVTPLGLRVPGEAPIDLFRLSAEGRLDAMLNGRGSEYLGELDPAEGLEILLRDYADLTAFGRFAWNPRYDARLDRRLGRVTCPALVVGVDEDRVLPASHIARYAELLPGARTAIASGTEHPSAHGVVAEEPASLAELIITMTEGQ